MQGMWQQQLYWYDLVSFTVNECWNYKQFQLFIRSEDAA